MEQGNKGEESRIITFDFLRGIAIWMMVVFHVIQHTIDYHWIYNKEDNVFDYNALPIPVLILLGIIFFLGTWDGLFILISLIVNMISLNRRINNGTPVGKAVRNRMKWGTILLIMGYIHNTFFEFSGVFVKSARLGYFTFAPFYKKIVYFMALQTIGLSIIICSGIIYVLYRNGGHLKVKRNLGVLTAIGFLVMLLTPPVWNWIDGIYPGWPMEQRFWSGNSLSELGLKLLFSILAGDPEPLFPYFITSIAGTMIGLVLSQEHVPADLPKYGLRVSATFFASVIIAVIFGYNLQLNFHTPDVMYVLFELSGQLFVIFIFLHYFEFGGRAQQLKSKSTYFRKWGMVALTIYFLQPIEFIPRYLVTKFLGWPALVDNELTVTQTLIVVALVLILWQIILETWGARNFLWSFEYFLLSWLKGNRGEIPDRLRVDEIITNVEVVSYSRNRDG